MLKIEGHICNIDELSLGIFMAYGEDEFGVFHSIHLGLLLIEISFYLYFS